jgi:hypothetical protein
MKIMKQFDQLPKTIKKTIRYIQQDANHKQLTEIQSLINITIEKRMLVTNDSK